MTAPAPWHDAYRLSHDLVTALPSERVPLAEAVGRTLTEEVRALCDVPHYASSAMGGWAVAGAPRGGWSPRPRSPRAKRRRS